MNDLRHLVLAASLGALAACSPPPEKAELHSLKVGVHEIEFPMPAGWQVMETALGPIIRTEDSAGLSKGTISFKDLGPCTPEGIRRTLLEAREHYRARRFDASREVLAQISLRQIVVEEQALRSFDKAWARVRSPNQPGFRARPDEIEPAYQSLLDRAALIPRRSLEELARKVIEDASQNGRQETTKREVIEVDGKPALVIDTWDRLSHKMRRRYLVLINDDHFFFMESSFGNFPEIEAAFEDVLPALKFAPHGQ